MANLQNTRLQLSHLLIIVCHAKDKNTTSSAWWSMGPLGTQSPHYHHETLCIYTLLNPEQRRTAWHHTSQQKARVWLLQQGAPFSTISWKSRLGGGWVGNKKVTWLGSQDMAMWKRDGWESRMDVGHMGACVKELQGWLRCYLKGCCSRCTKAAQWVCRLVLMRSSIFQKPARQRPQWAAYRENSEFVLLKLRGQVSRENLTSLTYINRA